MSSSNSIPRWVTGFAVAVAVLTWFLIIVGGIVHGTGSSLACPDWPTCYGSFFPEMTGGIFFEHSHRIVAAVVGFLSICLCIFLLWKGRGALRILGVLAVLLVIFQGVLGGITVIYRLPTAVSTAHLATSMLFIALMVWIAFRSRWPANHPASTQTWLRLKRILTFTAALVFFQLVVGALVRHTGAGLACRDIPLCQGSLWPAGASGMVQLQMFHRLMAVAVALAVVGSAYQVGRIFSANSKIRLLAWAAPALVVTQITLGLLSVYQTLALFPVTAHLAVGALLWINMVLFILVARTPAPFLQGRKLAATNESLEWSNA